MSCCGGTGVTGLCGTCCNTPCSCIYQNIFQQGGEGSPATAGQCVNLSGICVLDAYNSNTMYFRGIDTTDAAILSIALNATNHTIELTINVNALAAALPQATTSQVGVGETATDAEAQAKASIVNFVTPSNFAAMGASTTFAGFIEIATDAEAIAGASTSLVITPANLAAAIAANYGTTETFADSVARAAAVPAFIGQFAAQVDSTQPYIGSSVAAGAWNALLTVGLTNPITATTTVDVTGGNQFNYDSSDASGSVNFLAGMAVQFAGITDYLGGSIFRVSGIPVLANSVIITGGSNGQISSAQINTFISSANPQAGWSVTNPSVSRTLDVAAATLGDLRAVVGTLINDLKAIKLPAT